MVGGQLGGTHTLQEDCYSDVVNKMKEERKKERKFHWFSYCPLIR